MIYIVEEHLHIQGELGVTIGSAFQSLMNDADEKHICESLRLNHVHRIEDGSPRFCHIVREEEKRETLTVWSWSNAQDVFRQF